MKQFANTKSYQQKLRQFTSMGQFHEKKFALISNLKANVLMSIPAKSDKKSKNNIKINFLPSCH